MFHYTCEDAAKRISRRGFLRPWPQPKLADIALVWLTDLEAPSLEALGLEPHVLTCDRLGVRYVVDVDDAERWNDVAPWLPILPHERLLFERGRQPEHWFVIKRHVFASRDRAYRREVNLMGLEAPQ